MDEEIRVVLLADWDPAAIGENPNLRYDYDEFIPQLRTAIQAATNPGDIAQVLHGIEQAMHAPVDDAARARAATKLYALSRK